MKKYNILAKNIFIILYIVAIIIIVILNIENRDFFRSSSTDIISLISTLIIAIYIINSQSKYKNLLNNYQNLIIKFQKIIQINVSTMHYHNSQIDNKSILMHLREIRTKFEIILEYSKYCKIHHKFIDMKKYIEEYDELLSDNIDDINTVIKDVERISKIIDKECEKILLSMYC